MMQMVSLGVVLLYVGLFIWQCVRHQRWSWLWISTITWLVVGTISHYLLPSVAGINHIINLYLIHFYVLVGSVTCIGSASRQQNGYYLYYLALSSWLQYLALFIWIGLSLVSLHQIWLMSIGSSILQMVLVQPLFWLGSQWILMLLLYVRDQDRMLTISWRKQSLLVWVVLWQALYVFADVYKLL